jgi:arginyl-tRNA synthetase
VVLRADGTSLYVTQDIGTTLLKQRDFNPDMQVWVVGDEQIYHFQVLFAILQALGYAWAGDLKHMPYGMVNLPSGKMKSREGTVVDADDLFDEMEELARAATVERAPDLGNEELEERARVIAMAAVKFMLLKVNPRTTLMFDPAASVKFEGDTGPYVLYAYARISSMLRKGGAEALEGEVDWAVLGAPEERELALRCARFGDVVRRAAADFDTSGLVNYLLDLAKAFSRFYQSCPVLAAPSSTLRRARVELSDCVRAVLGAGLDVLTIGTLESM